MPVTERALVQRLNRALKKEGSALKTARLQWSSQSGWYEHLDLGRYYIVDTDRGFMVSTHVDLEALGRERGVLRNYERLVADE